MTVPASIEQFLKKHNVNYSLADLPAVAFVDINANKPQQAARAQLLQSSEKKKLLAITPINSIVNLEAISQTMGEEYRPLTGEALATITSRLGLDFMAAMPNIGNLPTIVDRQLTDQKSLLLSVGVDQQHIELDGEAFQHLVESTTIADIATPLSVVNQNMTQAEDIAQITASVTQFTELRIKQRLEETLELPPLPSIAQRIIKLRVDPNADVSDLCEIVELDASLAAQVVSWAASPYYSAPGTIKSIHDAVVRVLGFDMVMNLALGLALGSTLKLPNFRPDGCLNYWEQSVYVAACTEALISCMPREMRPSYGSAYLAGLLHNFGYLVTAEVFSEKFKSICEHTDANPHIPVQAIEQQIIGVDRNQLAAWLMDFWHIPEEVCVALRQQNNPDYEGEHWEFPLLIYITKKLLNEQGIRTGASPEPLDDRLLERFQLKREDATEAIGMILEAQDMLREIAEKMQG